MNKSNELYNLTRDEILNQRKLKKLEKKSKKSTKNSLNNNVSASCDSSTKNKSEKSLVNVNQIKIVKTKVKFQTSEIKNIKKHKIHLFAHLHCRQTFNKIQSKPEDVHPIFIKLGQQYIDKIYNGSNARCLALLTAIKEFVKIVTITDFERTFERLFNKQLLYLDKCRPMSQTMTHASKYLKYQLLHLLSNKIHTNEARIQINRIINNYIYENIDISAKAISLNVRTLVKDLDVIMTYAYSSLIERVLKDLHNNGVIFKVIIVDSLPHLEGRQLLERLVKVGIKCTYVYINAINFAIIECTKILIGAHTLLTNGYVMSRIGTSQLALMANARNVPVLVCCETYKFSERVQIDSFVYNEISRPFPLNECFDDKHAIINNNNNGNDNDNDDNISEDIVTLNLEYDVTPSDLVTAVVTELAVIPCTSVPVVLRVKPPL